MSGQTASMISNEKLKTHAPWRVGLLAVWLLSCLGFALGQSLTNMEPLDLLGGKYSAEDIDSFAKNNSAEKILVLKAHERQVLSSNPLDIQAIKNLAFLSTVGGQTSQFKSLIDLAASRTLQDRNLQIAAIDNLLNEKNYQGVMYRIDALARTEGLQPTTVALISSIAAVAGGSDGIVKYFSVHPKWRTDTLVSMAADSKQDLNVLYAIYSGLRKAGAPPSRIETLAFLRRLVTDKLYDKAYFIWLDNLDKNELLKVSGVFDGSFDLNIRNQYFDWTSVPIANAQVTLVPRESGSNDRTLVLDFIEARTPYANLSQMLKLAPGNYNLSGEAKAENLANDRGLVWRIYCLPTMDANITTTAASKGTQAWSNFTTNFSIPAENCTTQLLRLELDAVAVADTQISGRVYYDNIKIEPAAATSNAQ